MEFFHRYTIFLENYFIVTEHNTKAASTGSYILELNMFSDMSNLEFRAMLGTKPFKPLDTVDKTFRYLNVSSLPTNKNWFEEGAVTPVKS